MGLVGRRGTIDARRRRDRSTRRRTGSCGAASATCPEDRDVFAGLTVDENLRLAERDGDAALRARLRPLPGAEASAAAQLAGTLSGGQQQMLAIARALLNDNRVLLVDEPTKGLAPLLVTEVAARARARLASRRRCCSSSRTSASSAASRATPSCSTPGRVVHAGPAQELLDDEPTGPPLLGVGAVRMSTFVLLTITGLGLGAMYFLVASGLSLIYGLMGVLNFAHGAFITVGAYAMWFTESKLDGVAVLPRFLLGALVGLVVGALFAALVELVLIRPLYRRHIEQVLVTVGLGARDGRARRSRSGANDARPVAACRRGSARRRRVLGAHDPERPLDRDRAAIVVLVGADRVPAPDALRADHPRRRREPRDGDRARDRRPPRVHARLRDRRRRGRARRRALQRLLRHRRPGSAARRC